MYVEAKINTKVQTYERMNECSNERTHERTNEHNITKETKNNNYSRLSIVKPENL